MKNIKPYGSNVLIEPEIEEERSKGGIILPVNSRSQTRFGKVLKVGSKVDLPVKTGDRVYYEIFTGEKVRLDGKELQIVNCSHIKAIVED